MTVNVQQHKVSSVKAKTFVILILSFLILYIYSRGKSYSFHSPNIAGSSDLKHHETSVEILPWNQTKLANGISHVSSGNGCYVYQSPSAKGRKIRENTHSVLRKFQCLKRLPSVFLIGVKKSGTTTLANYLDLHQDIAMAFKAKMMEHLPLGIILHQYYLLMPYSTPSQTVIASFPGYYGSSSDGFFKLLPLMTKNPKLIVILRDPTERAVSDYLHIKISRGPISTSNGTKFNRDGDILKSTFEETVLTERGEVNDTLGIIRLGIYIEGLREFVNTVTRENILILSGDSFSKNPLPTLRRVENFLGLPAFYKDEYFYYNEEKQFYCAAVPSRPDKDCMSHNKGRTHPVISDVVLTKLRDFYRPYNARLGKEFDLSPLEFEWTQK